MHAFAMAADDRDDDRRTLFSLTNCSMSWAAEDALHHGDQRRERYVTVSRVAARRQKPYATDRRLLQFERLRRGLPAIKSFPTQDADIRAALQKITYSTRTGSLQWRHAWRSAIWPSLRRSTSAPNIRPQLFLAG